MEYKKPPLSYKDLLKVMKDRGLVVANEGSAEAFLGRVSFYRLKGYLLHFENKVASNKTHKVPADTTFEQVMEVYELDRTLRLLFFEAIEKVEIAFRSSILNVYGLGYGTAHWYTETAHFADGLIIEGENFHQRFMGRIERDLGLTGNASDREQPAFIKHYFDTYTNPRLPPCWMLTELMSLGVWSQVYYHLANTNCRKNIANTFAVPYATLDSWMHAISILRNMCAHHSRVWNRIFSFKPAILPGHEIHFKNAARIYTLAFVTAYLLRRIDSSSDWHLRFRALALGWPAAELGALGAPPDWDKDVFWSTAQLPGIAPKILGSAK